MELKNCPIRNFTDSPEIWTLKNLRKLSLASPLISTRKDLENFTKFTKSLDKLTELKLEQLEGDESVYSDESETKDESDPDDRGKLR